MESPAISSVNRNRYQRSSHFAFCWGCGGGYLGRAYNIFLLLQLQVTIDSIAMSSLTLRKGTHAAAIVGLPGLALLKEYSRSVTLFFSGKSRFLEAIDLEYVA